MKVKISFLAVFLTAMITLAGCNKNSAPKMSNLMDSASYAIGINIGQSMQRDSLDFNLDVVLQGLKDGRYKDTNDYAMNKAELMAVINKFQEEMAKKAEDRQKASSEKNKKEGADFMNNYKNQAGVVVTPSGLAYKIISEGSGKAPTENDSVSVKFVGYFTNGKVFQDSKDFGGEVGFKLGSVIPGWVEGIQKIKEGGKIELVIPENLAYGERDMRGAIPPGSTLRFEIELIKIAK